LLGTLGLSTGRGISHMPTDGATPEMACCGRADMLLWLLILLVALVYAGMFLDRGHR
jgi:hypothetical protein